MIFDKIKSLITILLSLLIAWGCYELSSNNHDQSIAMVVVMIISLSISGVVGFAANIEDERQSMLTKATSIVVFALFCLIGLVFSFFKFNIPFFVIMNFVILLIYALVVIRLKKNDY